MSISGSTPRRSDKADGRQSPLPPLLPLRVGPTVVRVGQNQLRGGQGPEGPAGNGMGISAIRRAVIQPGDERTFAGALF